MPDFKGLTIGAFESGPQGQLQELIEKYGGKPLIVSSPHGVFTLSEQASFILFTAPGQAEQALASAKRQGREPDFRKALYRIGIASINPACSQALRDHQLFPDLEAPSPTLESLLEHAAFQAQAIVQKKHGRSEAIRANRSPLMQALRREPVDRAPIWLMRQAGRYMAEYHTVRAGRGFMDLCKNPDLAAQATLDAVERLGVDAAIIFSDILPIVEPMGLHLEYHEGIGPMISNPLRTREAVDALKPVATEQSLGFLLQAIRKVRAELNPHLPLLGFCGAPFTMASYMIEGRGSKDYAATKAMIGSDPQTWHRLLEKITEAHIGYLNAQIAAGVQAVQVFDSWAGALTAEEYREFALPHTQRLIRGVQAGTPVIHFATGASHLLELLSEAGGDVISVDHRTEITEAWGRIGPQKGIQGNLDPNLLFSKPEVFLPEAEKILKAVGSRPGFIFNLGHGILPKTPVDHVMALVDFVKGWQP